MHTFLSLIVEATMLQGVPHPGLPKRDKPRRVEDYFSSWIIKPGKNF